MSLDELRSIFGDLAADDLSRYGVALKENFNPEVHLYDDYRVIYEVSFEPSALDKYRIEFWLTNTGHVAVGVETYERVLSRTGLNASRSGFASGHEPSIVSKKGLQILFDAL